MADGGNEIPEPFGGEARVGEAEEGAVKVRKMVPHWIWER
jgi:hypothetical protein